MAAARPTPALIPTRTDIHHVTADGTRHAGRVEYCQRCTPFPAPVDQRADDAHSRRVHRGGPTPPAPVIPATRRGDYVPPVMTTELTTRDRLVAIADRGPYRAPPDHVAPIDPPIGAEVLFRTGARTWVHGVVETRGYAGTRAAFVHPADLRRARQHDYPPAVRRARPVEFYPATGCA